MKIFTHEQLAAAWGITEKEVMEKIFNTFRVKEGLAEKKKDGNYLPQGFKVKRVDADKYDITVPDDYIFVRLKKTDKHA